MASRKLGMPLFNQERFRVLSLHEVAAHANNFRPRYMANIATVAKSHLIARVAKAKGKTIGLTEEDLDGFSFEVEDWEKAYNEVALKYDSDGMKKRDDELSKFVKKHGGVLGFAKMTEQKRIFSSDFFARVVAAQAKLE